MINKFQDSKLSFSGKPLYNVKVNKLMSDGNYKLVDARFTQLSADSFEDTEALSELVVKWKDKEYISQIVDDFMARASDTFCIETVEDLPLVKRIKAVMSRVNLKDYGEGNDMLATHITADPDIAYRGSDVQRPFKGVGEVSMYGTARLTDEKELDRLLIYSTNDKFFDNIGITKEVYEDHDTYRVLPKKDMAGFLKNIEEKFNFSK